MSINRQQSQGQLSLRTFLHKGVNIWKDGMEECVQRTEKKQGLKREVTVEGTGQPRGSETDH